MRRLAAGIDADGNTIPPETIDPNQIQPETSNQPNKTIAEATAQKQGVATQILAQGAPMAALTLVQALTHKASAWAVRVAAARDVLALNGFGAQAPIGGRGGFLDMAPAQLGEFVGSVMAELERRRQEHVIDGEVIPPNQGQQTDK
jgi:hypothetical protein